jgi:hypothetical protein
MSSFYRLYGDLILPDPTAYLIHDQLTRLFSLEPFLRDLETRRPQRKSHYGPSRFRAYPD